MGRPRDPLFKTTLSLAVPGRRLALRVPHGVFATGAIDEGTRLLLGHLPDGAPRSVLDLGCGYGALGLPIAARFAAARVDMVDRDLLAVRYAGLNAAGNGLARAEARASLGYRDLPGEATWSWIVCNVPARIGRAAIGHLLGEGRRRLGTNGELRAVVIRDLVPLLDDLAAARGWALTWVGRGPRHAVAALAPAAPGPAEDADPEAIYGRDRVEIAGARVERPHDLGGDDPRRLAVALPLILELAPRTAPASFLSWPAGYGAVLVALLVRWPSARAVAADRDLLATVFARSNARSAGAGDRVEVREAVCVAEATPAGERFDQVVAELSPSSGRAAAVADLAAIAGLLSPGGQGLILGAGRELRGWVESAARSNALPVTLLAERSGYSAWRVTGPG